MLEESQGNEPLIKPTEIYEVGQILIRSWGKGKLAKSRVARVTKATEIKYTSRDSYYIYNVEYPNGEVGLGISHTHYISFDAYRRKIQENIQASNKTIAKQEKEYQESFRIEEDAKKLFHK